MNLNDVKYVLLNEDVLIGVYGNEIDGLLAIQFASAVDPGHAIRRTWRLIAWDTASQHRLATHEYIRCEDTNATGLGDWEWQGYVKRPWDGIGCLLSRYSNRLAKRGAECAV